MIGAIILGSLSLLANIVGLAIPFWLYDSVEIRGIESIAYSGLWKACMSDGGQTSCVSISSSDDENIPSWFFAVRAMELIGMILMASAVVCTILKMTSMRGNANLLVAGAILALLAGMSMLIGTIVYGAKTTQASKKLAKDLHAGFGLCIAGGILAIVDSVVLFIYKSKMREAPYSSI